MPEERKYTKDHDRKPVAEQVKEITAQIEAGIKDIFSSDRFRDYLNTMTKFHSYSANNIMLIHQQKPDATKVAGYTAWKEKFGRQVNKGEKAIKILAPIPMKKNEEILKLDPDTHLPVTDSNGNAVREEKEVKFMYFKPVSVFDVSQTSGEPLPSLVVNLNGSVDNYKTFVEALKNISPVPVEFQPLQDEMDGFFSPQNRNIVIREGMSEVQTVCAMIHEITHAKLHDPAKIPDLTHEYGSRKFREVEIFGVKGLFTPDRLPENERPDSLHSYELRGTDENPGEPAAVERFVVHNYAGTVLTKDALELGEDRSRVFSDDGSMNFTGKHMTIAEFIEEPEVQKNRATKEIEAEAVSYVVCNYFGIETSENSFGYLAAWSSSMELPELKASLDTIQKTSNNLINSIEKEFGELMKDRNREMTDIETRFLTNKEDSYLIYQIDSALDTNRVEFLDSGFLEEHNIPVDFGIYKPVYTGTLETEGSSTSEKLEGLYEKFNLERPEDFTGHSLSVSDMVALKQNGEITCHYVDSIGFKEQERFIPENYLKNAEMMMEDDMNSIDGIINNGDRTVEHREIEKTVEKPEFSANKPALEKHSIQELLNKGQEKAEEFNNSQPKKEKNKEQNIGLGG